jgi:hypothetical protein
VWPDLADYERCIQSEAGSVTALYVGHYEPEAVFRAVTRLSLYCDRIYLVDPFVRAQHVRDEFNPLSHPEEHRTTVIKFSFLWMSLAPWIEAGMVYFIRPLHDFIPGLYHDVLDLQRQRFDKNPTLSAMLEEETKAHMKEMHGADRDQGEFFLLWTPDEALRKTYREMAAEWPSRKRLVSEEDFLAYIQKRRDEHPYYVDRLPGQTGELHQETSGASYELAKRMCGLTNSHLVTSLRTRWKEIELDRESAGIDLQGWSPFAKALHESDLKVLNAVPIEAAFRLREENRLESLRLFFRKVWKSCRNPNEFSAENAVNLSAELHEEVAKANEEWQKIDRQLLKWIGVAAITGITGLIDSTMKRHAFRDRYPAGFFLGLKQH